MLTMLRSVSLEGEAWERLGGSLPVVIILHKKDVAGWTSHVEKKEKTTRMQSEIGGEKRRAGSYVRKRT